MIMKVLLMKNFDGNDFVDFIVLIITEFDHSRSCIAFDTASEQVINLP
jgi:hypothetical protein